MSYKKKLWVKCLSFYAVAYTCLFLPILILCLVNRERYFVMNKGGLSIAFGGILLIIYVVLLAKVGFTKLHQVVRASMMLVIVLCLQTIVNDLVYITLCYWVGVVTFSIFQLPAHRYWEDLKIYRAESVRLEARVDMGKKRKEEPQLEEVSKGGRV